MLLGFPPGSSGRGSMSDDVIDGLTGDWAAPDRHPSALPVTVIAGRTESLVGLELTAEAACLPRIQSVGDADDEEIAARRGIRSYGGGPHDGVMAKGKGGMKLFQCEAG